MFKVINVRLTIAAMVVLTVGFAYVGLNTANASDPPHIDIEKLTNGLNADDPNAGDAPNIAPGDLVSWSYHVINLGSTTLFNVTVTDDQGVAVSCPQDTLASQESMICTASALAEDLAMTAFTTVPGFCGSVPDQPIYENIGTATGEDAAGQFAEDSDPSHYCNPPTQIDIEKRTNGVDADDPVDSPNIAPGDLVSWDYFVTNTGSTPLLNIVVTDDQGVAVSCPQDTLAPLESMTCTASGPAEDLTVTGSTTVQGFCGSVSDQPIYENIGTATGENAAGQTVQDSDPSHYCNPPTQIDIEKRTNGLDADDPNAGDAPNIAPGDLVAWSYVVTNTGSTPLLNIVVTDDQGVAVSCPQTTLAPQESMLCSASGPADDLATTQFTTVQGFCGVPDQLLYENIGTATGENASGQTVQDSDPSHYCNPPCGNGTVDPGEECDDGNNINGDGCQASCQLPVCGDGIVDPGQGEQCDDGNNVDGDGCQSNCLDPACGDGIQDAGEDCDDGNATDGDGCSARCLVEGGCCTDGPMTQSECIVVDRPFCEEHHSLFLGEGTPCAPEIDCVALVVTMDAMSAEATPEGVLIQWTTAVEVDTIGFRVLREMPDRAESREKTLTVIAPMIGAVGTAFEGGSYIFLDNAKEAADASNYYIEDIDIFGKVTRHGPIAIDRGERQTPTSREGTRQRR